MFYNEGGKKGMKIMTFYFTASMILVVKVIEFIVGLITGLIFDDIIHKFEEGSFLRKIHCWMCNHWWIFFTITCLIADVISVFVLSFIF